MENQLCRITVKNGSVASVADVMVVTGYLVNFEPESPQQPCRDILRPLEPDEPDSDIEVGYSRNVLEPLTIVYKKKKAELTKTPFIVFRYCYDKYRAEGQSEFEFSDIAEFIKGDELGMTTNAIRKTIQRIAEPFALINAPIAPQNCKQPCTRRISQCPHAKMTSNQKRRQ
jgi:hypothetical protein